MEHSPKQHSVSEKLRSAITKIVLRSSPEALLQKERDAKRSLAPSVTFDDEFLDMAIREDIELIETFYSDTKQDGHYYISVQ